MSQANTEQLSQGESAAYFRALGQMGRLLRQGGSWSGRERNCCFLNTGEGRFADVSGVSGFDYADDGRALSLIDWDRDGDLDVWLTNRTAPQVRVLRNDFPAGQHFLAVRLVGTGCNRDAIGARLSIEVSGDGPRTQTRTVRAGSGFLSQQTRVIHFGLGDNSEVERLHVRWPDGRREEFRRLRADRFYEIVQGSGRADAEDAEAVSLAAHPPGESPHAPDSEKARVVVIGELPLPDADYHDLSGNVLTIRQALGRPLLVNLWAEWCPACLTELRELADRHEELRRSGLAVLALNVEAAEASAGETADVAARVRQRDFPFPAGLASAELLGALELVQSVLLDQDRALPLPASFLVDERGAVAVMYRGPVDVERLRLDAGLLGKNMRQRREAAVPFAGRWALQPAPVDPLQVAHLMASRGDQARAADYVEKLVAWIPSTQNRNVLTPCRERAEVWEFLAELRHRLGDSEASITAWHEAVKLEPESRVRRVTLGYRLLELNREAEAAVQFNEALSLRREDARALAGLGAVRERRGQHREAAGLYREALALNPEWWEVANDLAWLRATSPFAESRDGAAAVELAERVCAATDRDVAMYLDTLGAAYAEAGRFGPAVAAAQEALDQAELDGQADAKRKIQKRLAMYRAGKPYREEVVRASRGKSSEDEPRHAIAVTDRRVREEFSRWLRERPERADQFLRLVELLATADHEQVRDPELASALSRCLEGDTASGDAGELNTISATQAANHDFALARQTARRALSRAEADRNESLAAEIRSRLGLYEQGLPARGSFVDTSGEKRPADDPRGRVAYAWYVLARLSFEKRDSEGGGRAIRRSLELAPEFFAARITASQALLEVGEPERAIRHLIIALNLKPDSAAAHAHLAEAYDRHGHAAEAATHYREALRLQPDWVQVANDYAWLLATTPHGKVRDPRAAIELAQQVCERTDYGRSQYVDTLAAAYAAAGRFNEASLTARLALRLAAVRKDREVADDIEQRLTLYRERRPYVRAGHAERLAHIGRQMHQQGELALAVEYYRKALQRRTRWSEVANDLAWILAAYAKPAVHHPRGAIALAEQLCEGSGYENPQYLDTLAVAYASAGRFEDAVRTAQRAVKFAEAKADADALAEIRARLELFRKGRAYVEQ